MEWQCEWGNFLPQVMSSHQENEDLPLFVQKMPLLREDLQWIAEAFFRLTGSRQIGFGVGPIPLTEIEAYVRLFGLLDDDIDAFFRLISAMDAVFVKWNNKRAQNG
jgi:hypothetical protein